MNDYDDLQLSPEKEESIEIAPDFDYAPGLILVPLQCDICKLLMYAREEEIGMWKICPDCGRKSLIRAVTPMQKVVVEFSPEGGYQLRPSQSATNPASRIVGDYRTIKGAVDYNTERLPNRVVPEQDVDPLEAAFDRMLERERKPQSKKTSEAPSDSVYGLQDQQSLSGEGQPRLVSSGRERMIETTSRSVPNIAPGPDGRVPIRTVPVPRFVGDQEVPVGKRSEPESVKHETTHETASVPWRPRDFVFPLFDERNRTRFRFEMITGCLALYMTLNLFRFFGQFLFSMELFAGDNALGTREIVQFLCEYMLSMLPFGVWFVFLMINGMTLFVQTKDGDYRIETWAHFRTDFALQYFIWIILLSFIAMAPGLVVSAAMQASGYMPIWRSWLIPLSLFLLFPILFLSVAGADNGLELFHRRIWRSLVFQQRNWFVYYLLTVPLWSLFVLALLLNVKLISWSLHVELFPVQIPFIVSGIVGCQVFRWTIYLYFRLLGTLDSSFGD